MQIVTSKISLIFIFFTSTVFAQSLVCNISESGLDFNKINGNQASEKSLFAEIEIKLSSVETNMKNMEDNILKLMRELGELKMQMQELKTKIKMNLDNQQAIIEQQNRELASVLKKAESPSLDVVVTGTGSTFDGSVTSAVDIGSPVNELTTSVTGDLSAGSARQDVPVTVERVE